MFRFQNLWPIIAIILALIYIVLPKHDMWVEWQFVMHGEKHIYCSPWKDCPDDMEPDDYFGRQWMESEFAYCKKNHAYCLKQYNIDMTKEETYEQN